jgi:endonuclease G
MRKSILFAIIFISFINFAFSQPKSKELEDIKLKIKEKENEIEDLKKDRETVLFAYIQEQIQQYSLPKIENGEELIEHKAFMLAYSEKHEQAKWVVHIIPTAIIDGNVSRTNNFRIDTLIKTGSAEEKDYFLKYKDNGKTIYDGFGYDRGHLAPSADFKWSKTALSESYFYSNMSPQLDDFNRGSWAKLEGMLRKYVSENNEDLFIVTGPILTDDLDVIERGINKVSIPKYYFKIAYDVKNNRAIGFVLPNEKIYYPIEYYSVSIDSIEKLTNIDFFYNLNDSIEDIIESQSDYKPFLPEKSKNDVAPMKILPKNCLNTVQAYGEINTNKKVKVCGTVVSTHKSKKGNVFLNLDKTYPDQIFSVTIWASEFLNFSYNPVKELLGKKVCITGKITEYNGTASMIVNNEKLIEVIE